VGRLSRHREAAAERWAARQQNPPTPGQETDPSNAPTRAHNPMRENEHLSDHRRGGLEDDLEL